MNKLKYHFRPNHRSKRTFEASSYEEMQQSADPNFYATCPTKEAYNQKSSRKSTEHVFFSLVEPVKSKEVLRFKRNQYEPENLPNVIYGVVADYDHPYCEDKWLKWLNKADIKPTYTTQTFSGNLRAIWEFEKPVTFAGSLRFAQEFQYNILKDLKVSLFYPGHDPSGDSLGHYFELGTNKTNTGPKVDSQIVELCYTRAMKKIKHWHNAKAEIPFEAAAEACLEQFSNNINLQHEFEIGCRCNSFWETDSVNPTGAIIAEDGVYSFRDNSFHSWREILGPEFVEKYLVDFQKSLVQDWYFCDGKIYRIINNKVTKVGGVDYFKTFLKTKGLKPDEIPEIVEILLNTNTVQVVGPALYGDKPIAMVNGQRVLNTSEIALIRPEKGDCLEWLEFMEFLFPESKGAEKYYFMYDLKHKYENAMRMQRGLETESALATYIVGPKCTGKTLLLSLIADVFGGAADPTDYFNGSTPFNSHLYERLVWVMDDPEGFSKGHSQKRNLTAIIKGCVARKTHRVNGKGEKIWQTNMKPQIYVAMNNDSGSIDSLPTLRDSSEDKIMLLATTDKMLNKPAAWVKRLRDTLPEFINYCRDKCSYTPIEGAIDPDKRFGGLAAYHSPVLLEEIEDQDPAKDVLEMIYKEGFSGNNKATRVTNNYIEGSTLDFLSDFNELFNKIGIRSHVMLGRMLSQLSETREEVEKKRNRNGKFYRIYRIEDNDQMEGLPF